MDSTVLSFKSKYSLVIKILVLMFIVILGFIAGELVTKTHFESMNTHSTSSESLNNNPNASLIVSGLAKKQIALIDGTIMSVNNGEILIKGDNNAQQSFKVSPVLSIIPRPTPGQASAISHDVNTLVIGSRANITLELQNNAYVVISVIYM